MITIKIHEYNKKTIDVSVNRKDSIQVLDEIVKGTDRRFLLFKGSILMTSFSFKHFGIRNGDHIFVLRASQTTSNYFKNPKSDDFSPESPNKTACVIMPDGTIGKVDKSLIREYSRIIDLRKIQEISCSMETKSRNEGTNEERTSLDNFKKDSNNLKAEPSSKSLPMFWNSPNN